MNETKLRRLAKEIGQASLMSKYQIKVNKNDIIPLEASHGEHIIWELLFKVKSTNTTYKYYFTWNNLEMIKD